VMQVLPSETAHQLGGLVSPMMLINGVGFWMLGNPDNGLDIGRFGPVYGIEALTLILACLLLLLARYRKVSSL